MSFGYVKEEEEAMTGVTRAQSSKQGHPAGIEKPHLHGKVLRHIADNIMALTLFLPLALDATRSGQGSNMHGQQTR